MKILHIYSGGKKGGVANAFASTVRGLQEAGHAQQLILGQQEPCDILVPIQRAPFRNRFFDWQTRWQIMMAIRQFQPDIIQIWPHRANWFRPRSHRVPVVSFIGGFTSARRLRKFYAGADHWLVPSEGVKTMVCNHGFAPEKVTVLGHSTSMTLVEPCPRSKLATAEDTWVIAAAGRLSPEKGFDVLLDALALLPDAVLWLAGDGAEENALQQQATRLGLADRVHFLGWRDDVSAIFAAADVVAIPSRLEGFGLVLIEAWAQAKPVVATMAEGPVTLIDNGKTGLLVPIDDSQAMAAALQRLRDDMDLCVELATNCQQKAHSCYTSAVMTEALVAMYQTLL